MAASHGHHIGKYELLEEIGRGSFAIVYKARDAELDRIAELEPAEQYVTLNVDHIDPLERNA